MGARKGYPKVSILELSHVETCADANAADRAGEGFPGRKNKM